MDSKKIKDTLLLPKTTFSQRFNSEVNRVLSESWESNEIYRLSLERNQNRNGNFIVHDGPPYANGSIHTGHLVNRILKDITIRFHNSLGFYTPFLLGWDTHGLPIEFKVLNSEQKVASADVRTECRRYATEQVQIQKNQLRKLGLLTDYEKFYSTQDRHYEATQIRILGELVKKKLVYRGLRPIYWSWSHKTALAENELEYLDKEDFSLFFKVNLKNSFLQTSDVKLLIWTTQPWTVPANLLIAVKASSTYLLIKLADEHLVIASSFLPNIRNWNLGPVVVEETFLGSQLIGLNYIHPYHKSERLFSIVDGAQMVSESEGSGILHVAPACGPEDFVLAKSVNLEVVAVLDENGRFTKEISVFELVGTFYQDANQWIIDDLKERNMIAKLSKFKHSYPHDWRDKTPLVYRLTEQWFITLEPIRNDLLANIEKVDWFPAHSKEKMISFINNRDDWCISRQRKWGVPIPALKINGVTALYPEILEFVASKVEKDGSDFWFEEQAKTMLTARFPHLTEQQFEIEKDTLDVWFDSGVSSFCVLEQHGQWPANLYLEGKDQFRGWFNSSLIIATILRHNPPYKKVVSHGFVVDNNGKKMSKSLGNVIDPLEIIAKYGIDTVRLWVASVDFTKEMKISDEILKGINDNYQKMRNTFRFILGNLNDIEQVIKTEADLKQELNDVDYYVLTSLWELVLDNKENYLEQRLNLVYSSLNSYCVNKLSSFYFEIIKDSLYCDSLQSIRRKQIVITLYFILEMMLKMVAPIMPSLADEIYQSVNFSFSSFFSKQSIQLVDYPSEPTFIQAKAVKIIENQIEKYFITLRKEVFRSLENARQEKKIALNIHARIVVTLTDKEQVAFLQTLGDLSNLFLVSEFYITEDSEDVIEITISERQKCERCWRFQPLSQQLCARCSQFRIEA